MSSETNGTLSADAANRRICVIGGGCAGLAAAYYLKKHARNELTVTLLESGSRLGGHANSINIGEGQDAVLVDTGFMVYNTVNYPHLCGLFDSLGVEGIPTDMGFSVSMDSASFEWCADTVRGLFATPMNLFRPSFYIMIWDIFRFNSKAKEFLKLPLSDPLKDGNMRDFLSRNRLSDAFVNYYLVPMTASIWSATSDDMLNFPALTLLTFLDNHLLLQTRHNISWMTPRNRSLEYVNKIADMLGDSVKLNKSVVKVTRKPGTLNCTGCVLVEDANGFVSEYDDVVFACHPDQILQMIEEDNNSAKIEKDTLRAFKYSNNDVYVHKDRSLMPKNHSAWTSWNYIGQSSKNSRPVFVTYWLNKLQSLQTKLDVFVSLNPVNLPRADLTYTKMLYSHPQFSLDAILAQNLVRAELQGKNHTYFAGAWLGYGFHEDGIKSGLEAAVGINGVPLPDSWTGPPRPRTILSSTKGAMANLNNSRGLLAWISSFTRRLFSPFLNILNYASEESIFYFLSKGFRKGMLHFKCPNGKVRSLGTIPSENDLTIIVNDARFFSRVALEYDLGLSRSFIAGGKIHYYSIAYSIKYIFL